MKIYELSSNVHRLWMPEPAVCGALVWMFLQKITDFKLFLSWQSHISRKLSLLDSVRSNSTSYFNVFKSDSSGQRIKKFPSQDCILLRWLHRPNLAQNEGAFPYVLPHEWRLGVCLLNMCRQYSPCRFTKAGQDFTVGEPVKKLVDCLYF